MFSAQQALRLTGALAGPHMLYLGAVGHPLAANPPDEAAVVHRLVADWFEYWLGAYRPRVWCGPPVLLGGAVTGAATRAAETVPRPSAAWSVRFAVSAVPAPHGRLVRTTAPLAATVMLAGTPGLAAQTRPVAGHNGFLHLNAEVWWVKDGIYHLVAMGSRWLGGRAGGVQFATSGGYGVVPRNARIVVIVEDAAPAVSAGGYRATRRTRREPLSASRKWRCGSR